MNVSYTTIITLFVLPIHTHRIGASEMLKLYRKHGQHVLIIASACEVTGVFLSVLGSHRSEIARTNLLFEREEKHMLEWLLEVKAAAEGNSSNALRFE